MTYGCHNRKEYVTAVSVQDGWVHEYRHHKGGHTRQARMVASPFKMTPDCQYTKTTLGQADTKCQGCKHRLDAAPKV